jgi:hypothetical protein
MASLRRVAPSRLPSLFRDVLHCFCHTGTPTYHGRKYREFRHGCYKVHVDVLTHPSNLSLMAWFTTAKGDDLDDTLERAAHQALMEFCERHLPSLDGTTIASFSIQNKGNTVWSECLAIVGDSEHLTYHTGWAFTACYAHHVSSML